MSSVVQILSPQAEELQAKRCELAKLRKNLADMELHLSTEKSELNLFEIRYQKVVGAMYAEMDIVKAQVLNLAEKLYPNAETFREEAEVGSWTDEGIFWEKKGADELAKRIQTSWKS